MSIKVYGSSVKRTIASPYTISQWTSKSGNLSLYKKIGDITNPDMRGADNLLFKPREMLSDAHQSPEKYDRSYNAVQIERYKPLIFTIAGAVVFFTIVRYLRT